jgi:hypothetical protein
MSSNYDLVKEIFESYDSEEVLNDFLNEFEVGEDISREEFSEFSHRYIDDMSEVIFIYRNWRYIESGGDESVFDEDIEEYDEDGDLIV